VRHVTGMLGSSVACVHGLSGMNLDAKTGFLRQTPVPTVREPRVYDMQTGLGGTTAKVTKVVKKGAKGKNSEGAFRSPK
jgi:hypothetical protein